MLGPTHSNRDRGGLRSEAMYEPCCTIPSPRFRIPSHASDGQFPASTGRPETLRFIYVAWVKGLGVNVWRQVRVRGRMRGWGSDIVFCHSRCQDRIGLDSRHLDAFAIYFCIFSFGTTMFPFLWPH
jgi:hypothetical protein